MIQIHYKGYKLYCDVIHNLIDDRPSFKCSLLLTTTINYIGSSHRISLSLNQQHFIPSDMIYFDDKHEKEIELWIRSTHMTLKSTTNLIHKRQRRIYSLRLLRHPVHILTNPFSLKISSRIIRIMSSTTISN